MVAYHRHFPFHTS